MNWSVPFFKVCSKYVVPLFFLSSFYFLLCWLRADICFGICVSVALDLSLWTLSIDDDLVAPPFRMTPVALLGDEYDVR